MKKKSRLWLLLMIVLCIVAGLCILFFVRKKVTENKAEKLYEDITATEEDHTAAVATEDITPTPPPSEDTTAGPEQELSLKDMLSIDEEDPLEGIEIPDLDIDWNELHELNKDIYAWLYVPGTDVDYPVLQHPTDDSYYLNYNIDGSYGRPGCIYTEATYNSKDFTDRNTLIYGHNMRNKTMFGTLHNFDDEAFLMDTDRYFYIYTEDKTFVYQVFAAYEYPSKHIMWSYDFSNEYVFEEYLKEIFDLENTSNMYKCFRHDIEVGKDDLIVTLSTCTNDSSDYYRYLVQGVLLGTKQVDDDA